MYDLAKELFPICRSLTGEGVRETLRIIQREIPISVHSVPSGTQAFDWTVPQEWNIEDAWLEAPDGHRFAEFKKHNLHVMGYSEPVDCRIPLQTLQSHLHSLPNMPDAIPYRTSYYNRNWGFCLTHRERETLADGIYAAVIKSSLKPGKLNYAELIIPGETEKEVFLSTYICHPSMANDQLSGPVVMVELVKWLLSQSRHYTYRIVFVPETIGSIVYASRNLEALKANVIAGFNIACLGNDGYSMVHSRARHTLADSIAKHVLEHHIGHYTEMDWLDRGGDERQYCAPGINLPFVALWRNVNYPEYHTSLDNLDYIKEERLKESFTWVRLCLECLEMHHLYDSKILCEPQMGKRGLYRAIGTEALDDAIRTRMNILSYCDGRSSLGIAHMINRPMWEINPYLKELEMAGLIERRP